MAPTRDLTPDERIARWKRTLDPRELWPGSTREGRVFAYRQILAATRHVLAGDRATLGTGVDTDPGALSVAAFMSGTGALVGWWIEQGRVLAPPAVTTLFADHLANGRGRAALMEERAARIVQALGERGIIPVVLKGMHTGLRYLPDPGVRPLSDIDFLVRPDQVAGARSALAALGLTCLAIHTRPQREDWGPPGHQVVHHVELTHRLNPWSVDLHVTLDRSYFPGLVAGMGTPGDHALENWASPFGAVRILTQPLLTAYLAIHAGSDFPDVQLARIVELVEVVRQDRASGRLDDAALLHLLRTTRTRRFAYPAFALASRLESGVVPSVFLAELARDATSRMRRTMHEVAGVPPHHFPRRSMAMRLAWAKGPRQVLSNMFHWVYPRGPDISRRKRLSIIARRFRLLASGRVGWSAGGE